MAVRSVFVGGCRSGGPNSGTVGRCREQTFRQQGLCPVYAPAPQIIRLFGAKDAEDFFELRERYTLKGVLGRIRCHILYLVGAEDWAPQSISQGVHCLKETGSAALTHCNKDNLHVMHAHTFNFLNEVLDYLPV